MSCCLRQWNQLGVRRGVHAIRRRQSVAISAKSIEPVAEQGRYPCVPSYQYVEIVGWDYLDHGGGRDVVFDVAGDNGRRQGLRFGLSDLELATGQLARFITSVLQREPTRPKGMEPHFARQMSFNHLVGRRVLLVVVTISCGVKVVIDWEAVPRE